MTLTVSWRVVLVFLRCAFLVAVLWLMPDGLRADWAPADDCHKKGVDCDADASVVEVEERKHFCSCNPEREPPDDDDEGCACSAPGSARSQRLSVGALALTIAGLAIWFERRRGRK